MVPHSDPTPPAGATILLVDDHSGVRDLTAKVLRAQGYEVIEAQGPVEAIDKSAAYTGVLHLLLTDVLMPGMSGVDLFRRLATMRADLRALFMSGYPEEILEQHGMAPAETSFVAKPFSLVELVTKVAHALACA